jgi:hypothetical protein
MEDVVEADIVYDDKKGRIMVSGLNPSTVKLLARILKRKKHVSLQIIPDGFVVSEDGLYVSKVTTERSVGYG